LPFDLTGLLKSVAILNPHTERYHSRERMKIRKANPGDDDKRATGRVAANHGAVAQEDKADAA